MPITTASPNELDPALLDYIEMYLLNYFRPGIGKTTERTQQGLALMQAIGCTSCHVQNFRHRARPARRRRRHALRRRSRHLQSSLRDGDDAVQGGGRRSRYPKLVPKRASSSSTTCSPISSATISGRHSTSAITTARSTRKFMTAPLWGIGTKAPYGHDGRSITLEDVILRHGGEAEGSKADLRRRSAKTTSA